MAPGAVAVERQPAGLGELNEVILRGKAVAVVDGARPDVAAGGLEQASFACVREIRGEDFVADAFSELWILDGKEDFNASVKITLHPIGATEIKIGCASIFEIEDAAVFEKASDNAANADATTDATQAGDESTLAANDEINFDAGFGGAIEGLNYGRIEKRVEFGDDARRTPSAGVASLAVDERDGRFCQIGGSDHERLVMRLLGVGGEEIEEVVDGGRDAFIAREEAEVRVKARGGRIVIAGAEVGVAADFSIGIVTDNEREFCVSL